MNYMKFCIFRSFHSLLLVFIRYLIVQINAVNWQRLEYCARPPGYKSPDESDFSAQINPEYESVFSREEIEKLQPEKVVGTHFDSYLYVRFQYGYLIRISLSMAFRLVWLILPELFWSCPVWVYSFLIEHWPRFRSRFSENPFCKILSLDPTAPHSYGASNALSKQSWKNTTIKVGKLLFVCVAVSKFQRYLFSWHITIWSRPLTKYSPTNGSLLVGP